MKLADRLNSGKPSFTAWSAIPDSMTVEVVAHTGFDVVTLDMQHGGHHEDSVLRAIPPIRAAGRNAIVRVPVGRFDMASRALDFGAGAIIAPMINSVADARLFAASVKYPPLGGRSWGASIAMPRWGVGNSQQWLETQNGETISFAMIETRAAYDLVDEILGVPGIDGIFVGPSDFSIAWSNGAAIDPGLKDMMAAIADIGARTRKAGKFAAIYVVDPGICGSYWSMGYQMFALGNEHRYMALGAEAMIAQARSSIG